MTDPPSDAQGPPRPGGATPQRLRIGLVAPPWYPVPPTAYGGIEAVVGDLVAGLVARGHEVTLVGAGRRGSPAHRFVATYAIPPSGRLGESMPEVLHAAQAARVLEALELDVVHDHSLAGPLSAPGRPVPTVVTAHGPVAGEPGAYLAALGTTVSVVAISDAQRWARPEINWVATVHNAVDVASYPLGRGDGGYVAFLGRFSPDKGVHLAIDAAREAGRPIKLAGKRNEAAERAYFDREVRPRLGPGVEYLGEADAVTKRELLAGAEALLFPVQWDEPFGIVMVEAMACGTPVVALRRGSIPEVVAHGTTGVIVDHPTGLAAAIARAAALDRAACRAHAAARFDLPAMVTGYEAVYRTVVEGRDRWRSDEPDPVGAGWRSSLQAAGSVAGSLTIERDRAAR